MTRKPPNPTVGTGCKNFCLLWALVAELKEFSPRYEELPTAAGFHGRKCGNVPCNL